MNKTINATIEALNKRISKYKYNGELISFKKEEKNLYIDQNKSSLLCNG